MKRILTKTEFGNPVLRSETKNLSKEEILSKDIQDLIVHIRNTLEYKKYGIGLAAPQVGRNIKLSIIHIRPTKLRPDLPKSKWASMVIINPKITKTFGQPKTYWEGCISFSNTFAKVPRFKRITISYHDENAKKHKQIFEGLLAHILQHEIDHLNGILFVDRIKDSKTFMSAKEYKKRIAKTEAAKQYD